MSCRAVRVWLHRPVEALDETQRLLLEDHLQGCDRCRTERAQLVLVRELGAMLPETSIGPRGHARAIAGALMRGPATPPARTATRRNLIAIAATTLGVGLVAIGLATRDPAVPESVSIAPPVAPVAPVAPPEDRHEAPRPSPHRLLEGELAHGTAPLRANDPLPLGVTLHSATGGRITTYGARVVIAAASDIVIGADRSLVIERGSIEVEAAAIRIGTSRYVVELDGSATFTRTTVRVEHGTARVVTVDGKPSSRAIARAEEWRLPEPPTKHVTPSARALLAQARDAYANGEFTQARDHATRALALSKSRADAAEAHTIIAECLLATGQLADAAARYESIATRYADLAAGETALFAAARLAARRRQPGARAMFDRYLARYPAGRFADDARRERGDLRP